MNIFFSAVASAWGVCGSPTAASLQLFAKENGNYSVGLHGGDDSDARAFRRKSASHVARLVTYQDKAIPDATLANLAGPAPACESACRDNLPTCRQERVQEHSLFGGLVESLDDNLAACKCRIRILGGQQHGMHGQLKIRLYHAKVVSKRGYFLLPYLVPKVELPVEIVFGDRIEVGDYKPPDAGPDKVHCTV